MSIDEAPSMGIDGFHAHIYFKDSVEREAALDIRGALESEFPSVVLGRIHDRPIGPHPISMYQVAFSQEEFASVVPWLMLNRGSLSVLVHPLTRDELAEHRDFASWLGTPLELQFAVFQGEASASDSESPAGTSSASESAPSSSKSPTWLEVAISQAVVRRALAFMLIVGGVLVAINHGDAILRGDIDAVRAFKMLLTPLVPYAVSTLSSVAAIRNSSGPLSMSNT